MKKKCNCGHEFEMKDAPIVGIQSGKLLLFNCPKCDTTMSRRLTHKEMQIPLCNLVELIKCER